MFIISITYTKSLDIVDTFLEEHKQFLEEQYRQGHFIASGRKIPRIGGIILSKMANLDELLSVLELDPFKKANLATYEVQEFVPSMTSSEFENLKE
jgi:uncharacterized protein YciI